MIPYIQNANSITVLLDGDTKYVESDHPNYKAIVEAVINGDENFVDLLDINSVIEEKSLGKLKSVDGVVSYNGTQLNGLIVDRINEALKYGHDLTHILNFLEKLEQNPSKNSVEQSYNFLSHKNLPIDEDGDFYAYKTVIVYNGKTFTDVNGREVKSGDYVDKYSSTIRNNVGDVVEFQRNKVDDNKNNHCSHGLHVGSLEYAGPNGWYNSPGNVVLLVKVNPKDCVSVPTDHSYQKLRVCKYEVKSVFKSPLNKAVYTKEDDLEYDDDYTSEEVFYVNVSELRYGDYISFNYKGKNRSGFVEVIDSTYVDIILSDNDPSYESGGTNYRKFLKTEMFDISVE